MCTSVRACGRAGGAPLPNPVAFPAPCLPAVTESALERRRLEHPGESRARWHAAQAGLLRLAASGLLRSRPGIRRVCLLALASDPPRLPAHRACTLQRGVHVWLSRLPSSSSHPPSSSRHLFALITPPLVACRSDPCSLLPACRPPPLLSSSHEEQSALACDRGQQESAAGAAAGSPPLECSHRAWAWLGSSIGSERAEGGMVQGGGGGACRGDGGQRLTRQQALAR